MADTGNGIAASFATSSTVFGWREIDTGNDTIPSVDITDLSDSVKTTMQGDIIDHGRVRFVGFFDATKVVPVVGVSEVLTITLPIHTSTNTTNAVMTGSGFLTDVKKPRFVNNEVQEVEMEWEWSNNATAYSYTVESV
jgi:hypothetical protein